MAESAEDALAESVGEMDPYSPSMGEMEEDSLQPQTLSQEHFLEALTVQLEPVNVIDMIRRCQLGGRLYSDQSFPSEPGQILPESKANPEDVEWKRVGELRVAPQLFAGSMCGGLVVRSTTSPVEDGSFLGALGAVATRPDLLGHLFSVERSSDRYGIYTVRLYKNGDWHDVVVDDQIPCTASKPAFGRCGNDNEMWVPLAEKAYAKLHRNYSAISGTSVAEALGDLTGGAVQRIYFRKLHTEEEIRNGRLWARLMRYDKWGYLMSCQMGVRREDGESPSKDWGILENYVYSILAVRQVNDYKLIHIRNPWGIKQWQGPWSDSAREWELKENQGVVDALGYVIRDDGTFWMAFQEFVKQFNKLYITRLFPSAWDNHVIKEGWHGPTAGGPPGQPTWCANPQYRLALANPKDGKSAKVFISLMQRDNRAASTSLVNRVNGLGFVVLQCKGAARSRLWQVPEDVVATAGPAKSREVCSSVRLDPNGRYMVVPHCNRGEEGSFVLRLWSDVPVTFERVKPACHFAVEGAWKSGMAGGRRARTTWCQNPQYNITVEKRAMVQVVLQRNDVPNMKFRTEHAVGLCVCNSMGEGKPARIAGGNRSPSPKKGGMGETGSPKSPGSPSGRDREERHHNLTASPMTNESSRKMIVGNKQLVAESAYNSLSEGSLLLTMEAGAEYVVVPSTYSPDIMAGFTLSLISSSRVFVTEMNDSKSNVLAGKWETKASTAGGSHLCDTWDDNPQFQVRGMEAAEFHIRLTRRSEQWAKNNKLDPVGSMLGFYIFQSDSPGQCVDLKQGAPKPNVVFTPEFLPVNEVSTSIVLENVGHPYVIVPCTFAAGKEGAFLLEVTCESGFQLDRVRKAVPHEQEAPTDARRDSLGA